MHYTFLFLSLFAPLAFALVNLIDEHLVKKVDDATTGSLTLFSGFFGFIVALIALIAALLRGDVLSIGSGSLLLLLLSGFLQLLWLPLYFEALATENSTLVVPLFQLIPLFVYILGIIFLGEQLIRAALVAGGLIVAGAFFLSFDFSSGEKKRFRAKATLLMVVVSLILSFSTVLFKLAALEEPSFWVSLFWVNSGFGVSALLWSLVYAPFRKSFMRLLKTSGWKVLQFNILNESLNAVGTALVFLGSLFNPVALVYSINSLQPLWLLAASAVIARYSKKGDTSGEVRSKKNAIERYGVPIAISSMIIGAVLIFSL